jgi:hypothetical protein
MPKINHRNSALVITLINHIYQLMTILQGNEIMFVCEINQIGVSSSSSPRKRAFLARLRTARSCRTKGNRYSIARAATRGEGGTMKGALALLDGHVL